MNAAGNKTETSPMDWAAFQFLHDAMKRQLENMASPTKREQFAKTATAVVMGCYFGLRYSDLSAITWQQVFTGGTLILKERKTGKPRELVINYFVKQYALDCFAFCDTATVVEPVISGRWGEPMSNAHFNRRLKALFIKFSIKYTNASSHVLRKTFGRRVYDNNGQSLSALLLLMRIFNHGSTEMTAKYLGINQELINQAYINLDG